MDDAGELESAYRQEAVRSRAALAARLGDVGLAEELVQVAWAAAAEAQDTGALRDALGTWFGHPAAD